MQIAEIIVWSTPGTFLIQIDLHEDTMQMLQIGMRLSKDCQRLLLFSTTYDEKVLDFFECIISDPLIIKLRDENLPLVNVT